MIVDERAGRRALKDVARFADRLDEAAGDQDCSVLDKRISARAALGRIAGEREDAAANDAGGASRQDVLEPERGDPVDLGQRGLRLRAGVIGKTGAEGGENVGLALSP